MNIIEKLGIKTGEYKELLFDADCPECGATCDCFVDIQQRTALDNAAPKMLEDWVKTALKIEKYNKTKGLTKNQLLDFIYNDAVKNVCRATGKSLGEIKELLNE